MEPPDMSTLYPDQTPTLPYAMPAPPTRLVRETPTEPGPAQPGPAFYPTQTGPRLHWTRPAPAPKVKHRRPWWRRWYTVVPALLVAAFIVIGATAPKPVAALNLCDKTAAVHTSSIVGA
jgi:hypothetical protein